MKLTINATAKELEIVNMLLAQAIKALKEKPSVRRDFGLSLADIKRAATFREKVLAIILHGENVPGNVPVLR